MSNTAVQWAFKTTCVKGPAKSILIYLCFRYNDRRKSCYPGFDTMARETGFSRSTVLRAVERLEYLGLIEVRRRPGNGAGRRSNLYLLPEFLNRKATPVARSEAKSHPDTLPRNGKASDDLQQSSALNRQGATVTPERKKKERYKERTGQISQKYDQLDEWAKDLGLDRREEESRGTFRVRVLHEMAGQDIWCFDRQRKAQTE